MYPAISGCTLHSSGTAPRVSNLKERFSPFGQVPRLCPSFLLPPTEVQKTLCATLSLFRKSTVVPTCTRVICGWKSRPFWSTTGCCAGAGKVLPAMASTKTTDSPATPETFPLMVPAFAATVSAATTTSAIRALRFMISPKGLEKGEDFSSPSLVHEFQSRDGGVGAERTGECLAASRIVNDLLRADLVLK